VTRPAARRRVRGRRVALVLLGLTLACGRKAMPRPPEDVVPATITDLAATQTKDGVELVWSRPTTFADGSRLTDLAGFAVDRWTLVGEVAPPNRLVEVPVTDRDRFRKINRFSFLDTTTIVGITYSYRVVSYTDDGYFSAPSNAVAVTPEAGRDGTTDAPLSAPQR